MNKNEYAQLQMLLAKLRFDLAVRICETVEPKYQDELTKQIEAIEEVMKIFVVDLSRK